MVRSASGHGSFGFRDRYAGIGDINLHLLPNLTVVESNITGSLAVVHRIGVEIIQNTHS